MKILRISISLLMLVSTTYLASGELIVVRSSRAEPYMKAAVALENELANLGYENYKRRIVNLDAIISGKMKLLSSVKSPVFAAIGTKAAVYLGKELSEGSKLTYCMVANINTLRETGLIRGVGIGTDIAIDVRLRLISEALPSVRAIGLLFRSDQPKSHRRMTRIRRNLPENWQLKSIDTSRFNSMSDAIKSLFKQKVDIIWTHPDASVYNPAVIRSLLLTSLRERIPVFGFSVPFVRAGALLGVGIDPAAQGKSLARVIVPLLEDESIRSHVQSAAVELTELTPEFEIAVNLIVAENLSITIPGSIIETAKYVYRADQQNN